MRGDPEPFGKLEQQARLVLQQRHLELVFRHPRVVTQDPLEAVGQLARRLDAGEAAADDDEMTQPAADRGVGLELDLRDAAQHHVADVHRVADRLQRQRVLGEPGDQVEPRAIAEREHQVLEGSVISPASVDAVSVLRRVDRATRPMTKRVRQHLPDRGDDLLRKDRRAERLGQHRIERRVALLADQDELEAGRQPAVERARERGAGEAAADDDDGLHMIHGRRAPCSVWFDSARGLRNPAGAHRVGRHARRALTLRLQ